MSFLMFLQNAIPNYNEYVDAFEEIITTEEFKKGTNLISPGKMCTKIFYINKGLLRSYYSLGEKDITHNFYDKNAFCGSPHCIFFNKPTIYGLQVLENSMLTVFDFRKFAIILKDTNHLDKLTIDILLFNLNQATEKLNALQFQTAESRYKFMIEEYPDILLRAPLGDISSYLGITQQTLSVIRAKKS